MLRALRAADGPVVLGTLHVAGKCERDALEPLARDRVVEREARPEPQTKKRAVVGAARNISEMREPGWGRAPAVPMRASL